MLSQNLQYHMVAPLLKRLYVIAGGGRRRLVARAVFKLLFYLEGGQYKSGTVRQLLASDYSIEVGAHTYGEVFNPGAFSPSVKVGRYTSIARGVRLYTRNHPIKNFCSHPYFYEASFGYVEQDLLEPEKTIIGNDVWIGANALILPGCKLIGDGAVIGAGAIVTKNVPSFAIVAGNPAKVISFRFDDNEICRLIESRWWELEPEEIMGAHFLARSADAS